jgi:two-component system, cell cycle sensor histidine kinase and response regulator CckA
LVKNSDLTDERLINSTAMGSQLMGGAMGISPIGNLAVRLLLVEDNTAEVRLLQELLRGLQIEVLPVQRLASALTQLETQNFDAILLDLTLPDSVGLDSLDQVMQQAPRVPIVVLTNTNDSELAIEAVRRGAQDYLIKRQITRESLYRSLRYAIERKQAAEILLRTNEMLEQRVQERTAEINASNQKLQQEIAERQTAQLRLELAQKIGKVGTFEWNLQGQKLTWTPELEALYGLAPGAFKGGLEDWLQLIHPDDYDNFNSTLVETIGQHQDLNVEFRILWPNQEIHWIAVKGKLFTQSMVAERMVGVHIDITDKKNLESQFLRSQRLESLGTLASGIAHDLNNVFTPILTVAQLLPFKFPQLDSHSQHLLRIVEDSARRGSALIKQILAFTRGLEGNHLPLQVAPLLTEIESILRQTLPKSIELTVQVPPQLWNISGDATQLHQVLMNLCVNGRDAMPQGGTLKITAENHLFDAVTQQSYLDATAGNYVLIVVEDSGTGIAEDVIQRIFDPFFTTKAIGKGTGLGLSAVLGIVKSHGGFVDVRSQVDRGSQFSIFIPATIIASGVAIDEQPLREGRGELILVVDDEPAVCQALQITLEAFHYRVIVADHWQQAIGQFRVHQAEIALVIMDLMMPAMDGFELWQTLQQEQPELRAIAISGLNATEFVNRAAQIGFQGFLAKPFTTQSLLHLVHEQLGLAGSNIEMKTGVRQRN